MARKQQYVNNKDFLEALKKYQALCREAEDTAETVPRVPDYIGECIYKIATRLATKPNFSGYSYKDDMISDGIENCLQYIHNFNPEKSQNPFAYFTQIIWFAFLRRIAKEKKQMYIRYKSSQSMIAMGNTYDTQAGEELQLNLNVQADYINTFIQDFEDKLAKDKQKKVKPEVVEEATDEVEAKDDDIK